MTKLEALKKYFGYTSFRPGQEKLIDALLTGRDCLGILPTGGGKSLCYQIPAVLLPGITIVISPLISLMRDQVAQLKEAGVAAAFLNSSLTPRQMDLAMERASLGMYKIIYVAPERLETNSFRQLCRRIPISLIAVDEAHCVSQWGKDFRPHYLKIADFVNQLTTRPPVGAFTATATDRVRQDMLKLLMLGRPQIVVTGFDRPNLYFAVESVEEKEKDAALIRKMRRYDDKSVIVYCATRKAVESVQETLQMVGIRANRYHAGMGHEERLRSQQEFRLGQVQVMVATNAFGMGIDKPDVRAVIHYNMPSSMEGYYQQAGRAGRDGEASDCVILFSLRDIYVQRYLIDNGQPNPELTQDEQQAVRRQDHIRLNVMANYCEDHICRRKTILRYFGQKMNGECAGCDVCERTRRTAARLQTGQPGRNTNHSVYQTSSTIGRPGIVFPPVVKKEMELNETRQVLEALDFARKQKGTLHMKLGVYRRRLATLKRIEAYMICSDRGLNEIAQMRPQKPSDLMQIPGFGETKTKNYGYGFIQLVKDAEQ